MIPKIIHYCWLSGDPYPKKIRKCLQSWYKIIPEYQFILWDLKKCEDEGIINNWVSEAYKQKKYAFASDYIRLYAVYKYGGIYLDTDVEMTKPFEELLELPYFIGAEARGTRVEIAAFGADKNSRWIKLCLDYYNNRHFIKDNCELDMKVMPDIIHETISKNYKIKKISQIHSFTNDSKIFNIFPSDWFCANIYKKEEDIKPSYMVSKNTYCIHHFANSWIKKNRFKTFIKNILIKTNIIHYIHDAKS